MSVIAKFFIQSATTSPSGSIMYQLGAVSRGEENKHWAAATPAGSLKTGDTDNGLLAMIWREHLAGRGPAEVEVLLSPEAMPSDGSWVFDACGFSYGGCTVKFRQRKEPWGALEMTINATGATKVLREAFAQSLIDGNPASFAVTPRSPQ